MAVVVHQAQQQSGVTTNANFYPVHHHVDHPVHDRDDDDAAVVADSLKDTILTHEMKELFHSWRQEFAIEYKTAKELEERMEVWLQNHGMSFVVVVIIVVLAVCASIRLSTCSALYHDSSAGTGTCTALRCTIETLILGLPGTIAGQPIITLRFYSLTHSSHARTQNSLY